MSLKDADLRKILKGDVSPEKSKLFDTDGLYLLVRKLRSGGYGLYWKYDYSFGKKRKTYSIGKYPLIGTTLARQIHREVRVGLAKGIDPAIAKRAARQSESSADNFKTIALAWLEVKEGGDRHKVMINNYFNNDIFPVLGSMAMEEIKPPDVVRLIERVSSRGSLDSARRVGRWVYKIFQYGMTIGRAENNPADIDFSLIIPAHMSISQAAIIDPAEVATLLREIELYSGRYVMRCLLRLCCLLMVRPGNLVSMEWNELDWEGACWRIPARKLKGRQHIKKLDRDEDRLDVPLSKQALVVLHELQAMKRHDRYVFQNVKNRKTHMITDSIRAALRIMGFAKEKMSGHGFRAMARTLIEEQLGYDAKIIEIQLGHKIKTHNAAYDRTQFYDKRVQMMQDWADYLDKLRGY